MKIKILMSFLLSVVLWTDCHGFINRPIIHLVMIITSMSIRRTIQVLWQSGGGTSIIRVVIPSSAMALSWVEIHLILVTISSVIQYQIDAVSGLFRREILLVIFICVLLLVLIVPVVLVAISLEISVDFCIGSATLWTVLSWVFVGVDL